jgi:hypothetical protein
VDASERKRLALDSTLHLFGVAGIGRGVLNRDAFFMIMGHQRRISPVLTHDL